MPFQHTNIVDDFEDIKAEIMELRGDLEDLASSVTDRARRDLKVASGRLSKRAEQAYHDIGQRMEGLRQGGSKALHEVQEKVEHYPLSSLFTAFAIGLFLGRTIFNRPLLTRF
jgi:ElaB/YqjD/DUF883 family membrane-anchored ribosome-binding protein